MSHCLIARISPKPEHLGAAREAVVDIIPATRREAGCLRFELFEGVQDGCLYLLEEWRDPAALDDHYAQAYTKAIFQRYQDWLAEPVTVTPLKRV